MSVCLHVCTCSSEWRCDAGGAKQSRAGILRVSSQTRASKKKSVATLGGGVCLCWCWVQTGYGRTSSCRVRSSSKQAGRQGWQPKHKHKRARQGMDPTVVRSRVCVRRGCVGSSAAAVCCLLLSRPISLPLTVTLSLSLSFARLLPSLASPHTARARSAGWVALVRRLWAGAGAVCEHADLGFDLVASCARDNHPGSLVCRAFRPAPSPQWSRQSLVDAGRLMSVESDTGTPRQNKNEWHFAVFFLIKAMVCHGRCHPK